MNRIEKLLEQLNQCEDLNMSDYAPKEGKELVALVELEAKKLGLEFDLSKNEEIKMNTNDLLTLCDIFYTNGYEDGANYGQIDEAVERFLSVEYNEVQPSHQTLVLYNGPAVVDSVEIELKDVSHADDQTVRDIAKKHFDNITDDIRVTYY